jgi:hypothetical protein
MHSCKLDMSSSSSSGRIIQCFVRSVMAEWSWLVGSSMVAWLDHGLMVRSAMVEWSWLVQSAMVAWLEHDLMDRSAMVEWIWLVGSAMVAWLDHDLMVRSAVVVWSWLVGSAMVGWLDHDPRLILPRWNGFGRLDQQWCQCGFMTQWLDLP